MNESKKNRPNKNIDNYVPEIPTSFYNVNNYVNYDDKLKMIKKNKIDNIKLKNKSSTPQFN